MIYDRISDVALSIEYVNQYVQSHGALRSQHIYLASPCPSTQNKWKNCWGLM